MKKLKVIDYIFSIKNEYNGNKKKKVLRFLGIKISFKVKEKSLLICRFDGIGDYVIMRKFLKNIRNSNKYKHYKIIFAGRDEFSDFAERFDSKYIDEFIWIPCQKFITDDKFKKQMLKKFAKLNVTDVISPVYDREPYFVEPIIDCIKAKNIYGHKGPYNRLKSVLSDDEIKRYNKNYTKFIDTGNDVIFEENRYKLFFEKVLEEKIEQVEEKVDISVKFNSEYVLIAPFSGDPIRKWDKNNFAAVINYIIENSKYDVGILGSFNEIDKIAEIINKVSNKNRVFNLAGKIKVSELPIYLSFCKLLIANETGTVHIANLTNTKVVCISNGSYMNRFQPYCSNSIKYIYPENINTYIEEHSLYGEKCDCDINLITAQAVIDLIKDLML